MKTLLALRGAGNRGKSTTLRMLIDMVKSAYPSAILEEKRFKIDITIVITIGKKKVGIETQGDPNSRLEESLKRFVEIGCKVIVCASRTYGQTVEIVSKAAESGYNIRWFEKAQDRVPGERAAANMAIAKQLYAALEVALGA